MALSSRRLPSLPRVPASPVPRSQRYYEGATTSHPRVHGRLLVCFHCPRIPPRFVFAAALPEARRSSSRPGLLVNRRPFSPGSSYVDANGISQVFRRSFLCLCSAPGPRSNRRVLAMSATSMLPPLGGRRRLRQSMISGLTRSFGTRCHTLHADIAAHVQGSLPAGRLGLYRVGVEPTGSLRGVSARIHVHPPLLLS
jgi:hypothetical protein